MQIHLNTDRNIKGHEALAIQLSGGVDRALSRFSAPADRAFDTNHIRAQINIAHMHAVGFFRSDSRLHS